jgi:hypothetical protein
MHKLTIHCALAAGTLAALVACGRAPDAPAEVDAPAVASDPSGIARSVVADMLSMEPDAVTVVSVQARNFSDSSLDCPEPGFSYLQVVTPGHQVLIEADGRRFDVRVAGGNGRVCHRRKPEAAPPGSPRGSATSHLGGNTQTQEISPA